MEIIAILAFLALLGACPLLIWRTIVCIMRGAWLVLFWSVVIPVTGIFLIFWGYACYQQLQAINFNPEIAMIARVFIETIFISAGLGVAFYGLVLIPISIVYSLFRPMPKVQPALKVELR